jgi:hypothetical protein
MYLDHHSSVSSLTKARHRSIVYTCDARIIMLDTSMMKHHRDIHSSMDRSIDLDRFDLSPRWLVVYQTLFVLSSKQKHGRPWHTLSSHDDDDHMRYIVMIDSTQAQNLSSSVRAFSILRTLKHARPPPRHHHHHHHARRLVDAYAGQDACCDAPS